MRARTRSRRRARRLIVEMASTNVGWGAAAKLEALITAHGKPSRVLTTGR
jgi:hypothetical protein